MDTHFKLYRGTDLIGSIELIAELCDFPWYGGLFSAEPAFASVSHLFRQERQLLENDEMDEWEQVWAQIEDPGLKMVPSNGGEPEIDLLIHIDGTHATWRS